MDKLLSDVLDSLKDESKKIAAELPSEEELVILFEVIHEKLRDCLLYTSPSPRDGLLSRMPSSA